MRYVFFGLLILFVAWVLHEANNFHKGFKEWDKHSDDDKNYFL